MMHHHVTENNDTVIMFILPVIKPQVHRPIMQTIHLTRLATHCETPAHCAFAAFTQYIHQCQLTASYLQHIKSHIL